MPDWPRICQLLGIPEQRPQSVSGGNINAAWRLGDLFLKTAPLTGLDMFSAEAAGLAEIAASESVRVPEVRCVDAVNGTALIAMEWLQLERSTVHTHTMLGEQLAAMHARHAEEHGWFRDNTIGRTPQPNNPCNDWVQFFREQRLEFQLRLAVDAGYGDQLLQKGERLLRRLDGFFAAEAIVPSLLHGDLWGGNWGVCEGEPVLFDPAVYYGDAESDIAMTRLFGGFGAAFYAAYDVCVPRRDGAGERCKLYQLYHELNHLNLYGRGYLGRATALMDELL